MKFYLSKLTLIVPAVSLICFFGCDKKVGKLPVEEPPKCKTSFMADIKPVIDIKCVSYGCHTNGATIGDFTTYEGIKPLADNGRMNELVFVEQSMPIGCALTPEELRSIKCWLDNGAPNN